jgi:hypothetical protein
MTGAGAVALGVGVIFGAGAATGAGAGVVAGVAAGGSLAVFAAGAVAGAGAGDAAGASGAETGASTGSPDATGASAPCVSPAGVVAVVWVCAGSGAALVGSADDLSVGLDGDPQPTASRAMQNKVPLNALLVIMPGLSLLDAASSGSCYALPDAQATQPRRWAAERRL